MSVLKWSFMWCCLSQTGLCNVCTVEYALELNLCLLTSFYSFNTLKVHCRTFVSPLWQSAYLQKHVWRMLMTDNIFQFIYIFSLTHPHRCVSAGLSPQTAHLKATTKSPIISFFCFSFQFFTKLFLSFKLYWPNRLVHDMQPVQN